ncbi:MAG: glycoside hydrolase family 15 protein [Solirubrobacteraceae bacterium]
MRVSVARILANQEPNGALVASRDFATYNYCWLRDGSFIAFALDRAGEHQAARRFHLWVASAISGIAGLIDRATARHGRPDGLVLDRMPPARFGLDGSVVADDWPNFQIDGYGTWLWALEHHLTMSADLTAAAEFLPAVRRVAGYVNAYALSNCFDVWEEHASARHGSTLACVYGGLMSASRTLAMEELAATAEAVRAVVTDSAARLGHFVKSSRSDAVDSSLLWLATPFGLVEPRDPFFQETVRLIVEELTYEGGLRRYPADTYYGGGAWPVLTASLGWHYAATGDREAARNCHKWITDHIDAEGRLAEQFGGERRDPVHYAEWKQQWGPPATDLAWSHAMYVVLCTELNAQADVIDGAVA